MNFVSYSVRVICSKYLDSRNLWKVNGYLQTTIQHFPLHSYFQQENSEYHISQVFCLGTTRICKDILLNVTT